MFTGIVQEVGEVEAVERGADGVRLAFRASLAAELAQGDSVAVDGACLTVASRDDGRFVADVMNQTLSLTTLGALATGDRVNLEPAARLGDRLGGHLVQGHVDAAGSVVSIEPDGFARRAAIAIPDTLRRYVVERGSVALAGVSLTVASLEEDGFTVSLIPETLGRTTLGALAPGDPVNVEVDMIARHLERLVQGFTLGGDAK